jgi:hypothetical protein
MMVVPLIGHEVASHPRLEYLTSGHIQQVLADTHLLKTRPRSLTDVGLSSGSLRTIGPNLALTVSTDKALLGHAVTVAHSGRLSPILTRWIAFGMTCNESVRAILCRPRGFLASSPAGRLPYWLADRVLQDRAHSLLAPGHEVGGPGPVRKASSHVDRAGRVMGADRAATAGGAPPRWSEDPQAARPPEGPVAHHVRRQYWHPLGVPAAGAGIRLRHDVLAAPRLP